MCQATFAATAIPFSIYFVGLCICLLSSFVFCEALRTFPLASPSLCYQCAPAFCRTVDSLFRLFDLVQVLNRLNSFALNRALDSERLRIAPIVKRRNLMNACDRAVIRTGFLGQVLAANVFHCVAFERDCRVPSLLRTIVDKPVLADVQVASPRAASPAVWLAVHQILLKAIDPGVPLLTQIFHLEVDVSFGALERLERSQTVVDDAKRTRQAQIDCATADSQRIFRCFDSAANHRVDVDAKLSELRKPLEFLIEQLQALLRNIVGRNVVYADLHVLEPSLVELLDLLLSQQISVCNKASEHSAFSNL